MTELRGHTRNDGILHKLTCLVCAVAIAVAGMPGPLSGQADTGPMGAQRVLDSLATGQGKQRCFYRTALREFPGRSLTACSGTDDDTLTYFYRDSTGILASTKQITMDERDVRAAADSVRQTLIKRYGAVRDEASRGRHARFGNWMAQAGVVKNRKNSAVAANSP